MEAENEIKPDGMLVLASPVSMPDVLDMIIVGGGPAGTAAAFHAKELKLSALVIDYDDVLKRIRDYPKDKLILPDFGGGDQMKFPKGDRLISLLHFAPLDKDEIVREWKRFYRENSVPAQVGIELLGLARGSDGVWQVKTWNHNTKIELLYRAKHVVIGIGRGVPRRFDIPGNTDGIAYRLADANAYVGAPSLIIGGGTSAAEAVIAISHAKVKANDASPVFWSYRGDKLPKVSKALADVFFEAYMGNGNIRYHPNSEPVAVVTGDDRKDYLSLRTDRRCIAGRPNETSHLEFQKEFCIACIGEDIPEGFLNSMGIFMATGGPSNKKRMVVNSVLETQQPNVYLIGDILSQAYLETDIFDADPATFREIKHRGNIKAAMRDGVLVAKVAAQKIAGKKEFDIELDFEEGEVKQEIPEKRDRAVSVVTMIVTGAMAPKKETAGKKQSEEPEAFLIKKLAGGVEENEFQLKRNGITTIGRKFCDIVFPDDDLLSDRDASISHGVDGYVLRDDGSATGVFLRAQEGKPVEMMSGDLVRMGRQFLLFKSDNGKWSFIHYDQNGKQINKYDIAEKTIVLGRDAPDITLEKNDMTLSRRHLSLTSREGKIFIKDLKSINGSYRKVRDAVKIEPEDEFRLGRQHFKLSLQVAEVQPKARISTRITPSPLPAPVPSEKKQIQSPPPVEVAPPKAAVGAKLSGMVVAFKNVNDTFEFKKGQTICEIAEHNGVKVVAECHAGICGSDPIRILSGKENLNPIGGDEKGTLEDICGVSPGECRLACMVKPTGAVEVEILKS